MLFSKRPVTSTLPIVINNNIITCSSYCDYLGVQVDNSLSFRGHINNTVSKIAKHTGILYRIKNNLPINARLDYYYSFIYPFLTYNVTVWGATYQSLIDKIFIQQKRTVRLIADLNYNEHTSKAIRDLKLLKFFDINRYHCAIYMFKNHGSPRFQTSHSLNTRNNNLLRASFNRLSLCQHSIGFQEPHIWNNVPLNIYRI